MQKLPNFDEDRTKELNDAEAAGEVSDLVTPCPFLSICYELSWRIYEFCLI